MKLLVLSSESSVLRYVLFDMPGEKALISGKVDSIGLDKCRASIVCRNIPIERKLACRDTLDAVVFALKSLKEYGVVSDLSEVSAIAHRLFFGGDVFPGPVLIDSDAIRRIRALIDVAPELHNNLSAIIACRRILPKVQQAACFETSFFQSLAPENYLFALPYELYRKHGLRKHGAHGLSHSYVASQVELLLGKKKDGRDGLRIISCHLGAGSSVAAIRNGRAVATSAGLSLVDGLPSLTSSGSVDPAVLLQLIAKKECRPKDIFPLLSEKSGLLGVSGKNASVKELRKLAVDGNERARLALDIYANRISFFISGLAASLGGVDAIVFTGGVGEKAWFLRRNVLNSLSFLGVEFDVKANRKGLPLISTPGSKVNVYVIPSHEAVQIAKEVEAVLK